MLQLMFCKQFHQPNIASQFSQTDMLQRPAVHVAWLRLQHDIDRAYGHLPHVLGCRASATRILIGSSGHPEPEVPIARRAEAK